jgi:Protein of unknown function (DUF2804)
LTKSRVLEPAPASVIDPVTGLARYGAYEGALERVDLSSLGGGTLRRLAREKRWMYVAIASEEVFAAFAIARFGYASTCFGYVLDARTMRMAASASVLAPPSAGRVSDRTTDGSIASFRFAGARAEVTRPAGSSTYAIDVDLRGLAIHAVLDPTGAPPGITAIAPVGDAREGCVNVTEKRALLAARGEVTVHGQRRSLHDALGGYDYTHGVLARRTKWRWAFALGRAKTWRVSTADGAVDLRFKPGAMHSDHKNLGLVASRFVQPVGVYAGTMRLGGLGGSAAGGASAAAAMAGRELVLEGVLGVTEDQDVLW